MKIHVQEYDGTNNCVRFDREVGTAEAKWMGDLPDVGSDYYVEIAINKCLVWGDDIIATESLPHRITQSEVGITLEATLESIDSDGFAVIRLGITLVLIETEGTPPPVGTAVQVRLGELLLSDIGI
jgi:hypothetical protein